MVFSATTRSIAAVAAAFTLAARVGSFAEPPVNCESRPYSVKSTDATTKPHEAMPESGYPYTPRQPPAPCENSTIGNFDGATRTFRYAGIVTLRSVPGGGLGSPSSTAGGMGSVWMYVAFGRPAVLPGFAG